MITFSHIILRLVNSSWPVPVANEDWLLWFLCTLKILVAHFLTFAYACELVMVGRLWPLLLEELLLLVLFLHNFVRIQLFWFSHGGLSFHRSNLYFLFSCPFDFPDVSGLQIQVDAVTDDGVDLRVMCMELLELPRLSRSISSL